MGGFDLKRTLTNQNNRSVITGMLGVTTKYMAIPYTQLVLGDYKKYEIDEQEVLDLADSIAAVGLEQNLVVKETEDPNRYIVVTGHKRTSAIFYIFENDIEISANVRKSIEEPMCIIIPKDEEPLITRFRMHETNVHQRKGFSISEIEDYINTVEEAKAQKLEVNGKKIKGTTRVILHQQFGFSETTAKKYIKVIKEGNAELKKAIDDGEMSINNAYDLLMGNAEPIINSKDEDVYEDEKIKSIEENKPKEKVAPLDLIKKSSRKSLVSFGKLFKSVDENKEYLPEETINKISEVQKLLLDIDEEIHSIILDD